MARVRWEVNATYPAGRAVPYTAEEEARAEQERVAGEAQAIVDAAEAGNETTLRDRADAAIVQLEQAHTDWATLTNAQKDATLRLNVRVTVALARLALRKLDST